MKQQILLFTHFLKCQVFIALAMLFLPLTVGAKTATKTYVFNSFYCYFEPQYESGYIIPAGESTLWEFMGSIQPVNDNGLMFKGVSESGIKLHCQYLFPKIFNVTVKLAAAPNSNATYEEQTVYLNAGSNSFVFVDVTPSNVYRNNSQNLIFKDYTFEVNKENERLDIDFLTYLQGSADVCIKEVTVTYSDGEDEPEPEPSLGLTVLTAKGDSVDVTASNKDDILGDGGSVKFDGNKTLILNSADLSGICSELQNGLNLYLLGSSFVQNDTELVTVTANGVVGKTPLTFMTNDQTPGSLMYINRGQTIKEESQVFQNFDVTYKNNLGMNFSLYGGHEAMVLIKPVLNLIVDSNEDTQDITTSAVVDYEENPGEVATVPLTNTVINNVLYTLDDHGNASDPDGFDKNHVVLNSEVSDAELMMAMSLQPGTDDYAAVFKGLTFLVPPSIGEITLNAWSDNSHPLCVKVGGQEPTVIQLTNEHTTYTIPYASSESSKVYIYLPADANTPALASQQKGPRIGPKSSVSGGLGGLSVSGSSFTSVPDASTNYLLFDRESFLSQFAWLGAGSHITVNNSDYTDLEDNMFLYVSAPSLGSQRAASLAINDAITYVDMTATSITGKEVSRHAGPFNGLPDNIFIYMPAGNSVAPGTKNVVIGGICETMELDGSMDAKPFEAAADFTAGKVSLMRPFSQDATGTLYLPFAISNPDDFGSFYTVSSIDNSIPKALLTKANYLSANKAYVFKAATDLPGLIQANAQVYRAPYYSSDLLQGTYTTLTETWNCYYTGDFDGMDPKPSFMQVTGAYPIYPFRGYIEYYVSDQLKVESDDGAITNIDDRISTERKDSSDTRWYLLDGRRLNSQPTDRGIFIHHGKKVIR